MKFVHYENNRIPVGDAPIKEIMFHLRRLFPEIHYSNYNIDYSGKDLFVSLKSRRKD